MDFEVLVTMWSIFVSFHLCILLPITFKAYYATLKNDDLPSAEMVGSKSTPLYTQTGVKSILGTLVLMLLTEHFVLVGSVIFGATLNLVTRVGLP